MYYTICITEIYFYSKYSTIFTTDLTLSLNLISNNLVTVLFGHSVVVTTVDVRNMKEMIISACVSGTIVGHMSLLILVIK